MAEKEVLEFQVDSNIGEVSDEMENLSKTTEEATQSNKDLNASAGAGTFTFQSFKNIVVALGTALKALGVGLIITALTTLGTVFRSNQKVVDFFNIAMESLTIAFNDLFKFLDNNVGNVVDWFTEIFDDPQQSLKDFGNAITENLIERFNSLLETFGHLGKALGHLIDGEFAEAWNSVKEAGKESVDIWTGVDDSVDKIGKTIKKGASNFKEYTKSVIDTATATIELRKASELAAVKVQGLIEEYDRQAEKLRQVRDDESKTFEERIAANNKLGDVLKEQEKEMLKLVDIRIAAAQIDVDTNNNLENQIKLQEALNEKKGVLAQITGFQSEQLVNNISLLKEQKQVALENANAQLEAYSSLANSLSSLAGENKELAIAGAIIDTYRAANAALATGGGTPLAMLQAGAIVLAGLANVKKIMEQDVGTGAGGGSVADTATPTTPAPQMMSGTFQLGGGVEPEPARAYVVSDDITNNQNKLAIIRRRATI